MYLTHGSRAGSVEGFGDRDGRRGARGTEDHREVRGIGDSSESLVGSDPGDIAGKQQPRTCRADAAPHDGRRPGRGQEGAGCQRRFPVITARSMDCSSEPGVIVAGAGALPRARRRCEAGKRTHGPGTRTCLALLAATALLALAAPAQAQTEVWSATLTPADIGSGLVGCLDGFVASSACSITAILSDNEFTHNSTDYTVTGLMTRSSGSFYLEIQPAITTATGALTLVVGSTSLVLANATSQINSREWASSGVSLTIGTDITVKLTTTATTNTAAMGAPTITGTAQVGQTLTAVTTGITDADGLTSPTYTYQWIRVDGHGADIAGENSSTYTLDDADLGKTIKVKVSFDDDASNTETLTSAATVTVTAAASTNTAPTAADKTVTTGEDRAYAFEADDFAFDDDDAGDTLASVTIVTVPDEGTLTLDNTAVIRRRHGGPGGRRRHQGPDRRRHAHLHARARCARRPLYDLHLHGERRHGRQRQRLHDDHRRDGRPPPRLRGARYRRRRPAPDLDQHGDGGAVERLERFFTDSMKCFPQARSCPVGASPSVRTTT